MQTSRYLGRLAGAAALLIIYTAMGCSDHSGANNPVDSVRPVSDDSPHLSFEMWDCALPILSRAPSKEVDLVLEGTTVHFRHSLETFCNAKTDNALAIELTVKDGQITVNEIFRGTPVRCTCLVPISGAIEALKPGTYGISFVYLVEQDGVLTEAEVLYEARITVFAEAEFNLSRVVADRDVQI